LERKLLPPRVYWSEWQRLLDDSEYNLVCALARGGAGPGGKGDSTTWHDDRATLCQDARELELLERIRAIAEANAGRHRELHMHMLDLRL
jgi:hypothetical protein